MYPNDTDALNFGEAYLSLGYDFKVLSVSAMYALGVDTHSAPGVVYDPGDAWELGVSVPLPMDVTLDGTYGEYDDAQNGTANGYGDYYSVGLSKTFGKFDTTLAYTGMDYDDTTSKDEDNVVLTVGTSF